MSATLEIVRPGLAPTHEMMPVGVWSIGRDSGNIVLNDPNVSSTHGQLQLGPQGLVYADLGSANGSYLGNGHRITQPVQLGVGSQLRLGNSLLIVRALQAPQHSAAQPVAPVPAQPPPAQPPHAQPAYPAQPGGASTSHPGAAVRHSYPIAIKDAGVGTAFGLMLKTFPYALARFGILVGMSVVSIVWFVITLGGAGWLSNRVPILGAVWGVVGFAAYGWVWWAVVRYFMYLLKAGHIAVLTELITKGSVDGGQQGLFSYGKQVVTDRFGEVNAMFALDLLVHGVVRAFNRTLNWIANLLPIPGLQGATRLVNKLLYAATTYIDETVLSYNLARGDDNVWQSSKDGLIYYAQNSKEVLKTAVWIVVLDYVLSFLTWVVMLAPAFVIGVLLPKGVAGGGTLIMLIIAVLFASNVRSAFLKPLFLTMVMTKFHVCAEGQAINEEWDSRLSSASSKFQQLKDKALNYRPAAHPSPTQGSVAAS